MLLLMSDFIAALSAPTLIIIKHQYMFYVYNGKIVVKNPMRRKNATL